MRDRPETTEPDERAERGRVRPPPYKQRRHQRQRRQVNHEHRDDLARRLGAREKFDGDVVHRRAGRRQQQDQEVRVEPLAARPHDHEHADKADDDRAPAAKPDVLMENQHGRYRGEKGRGEIDGGSSRQRHHGDPIEPGRHRDKADRRAQQVKPGIAAAHQRRPTFDDPRKHEHEPEQATKESHFERVHRLSGDADEYVHHHRADSAEQDPQCSVGSRREPRHRPQGHQGLIPPTRGGEMRRIKISEAALYRRAARIVPPGSAWSARHSIYGKRRDQGGFGSRSGNRTRRRCETPTRSRD